MLRLRVFLAFVFLVFTGGLNAQGPIIAEDITGTIKAKSKPITIQSSDANWLALAKTAFNTHGGFRFAEGEQADYTFQLEPAGQSQCKLTIFSGRPAKVLYAATVSGSDGRNAMLKACDLAVQKTLNIPGYFAGKIAFVADRTGKREIWVSDLFFKQARQLTTHRSNSISPHWSPDGRKLLYTSYYRTGFPDILLWDFSTNTVSTFASYKGTNTGGVFSPDGSRVAMILSPNGNPDLYVAPASGRNPNRLAKTKGVEASPAWSPDGRQIVYTSDERGGPQLFVIPANGGNPKFLRTGLSRYIDEPDWNPRNADQILFTAAAGGSYQLGLLDLGSKEASWLTKAGYNSEGCWLNDGRHIVFVAKQGRWNGLSIVDSETGKISALHSSAFGNAWQPDFVYAD